MFKGSAGHGPLSQIRQIQSWDLWIWISPDFFPATRLAFKLRPRLSLRLYWRELMGSDKTACRVNVGELTSTASTMPYWFLALLRRQWKTSLCGRCSVKIFFSQIPPVELYCLSVEIPRNQHIISVSGSLLSLTNKTPSPSAPSPSLSLQSHLHFYPFPMCPISISSPSLQPHLHTYPISFLTPFLQPHLYSHLLPMCPLFFPFLHFCCPIFNLSPLPCAPSSSLPHELYHKSLS